MAEGATSTPFFFASTRLMAAMELESTGAQPLPSKLPSAFWASWTLPMTVSSATWTWASSSAGSWPLTWARTSAVMCVSTSWPSLPCGWVPLGVFRRGSLRGAVSTALTR